MLNNAARSAAVPLGALDALARLLLWKLTHLTYDAVLLLKQVYLHNFHREGADVGIGSADGRQGVVCNVLVSYVDALSISFLQSRGGVSCVGRSKA